MTIPKETRDRLLRMAGIEALMSASGYEDVEEQMNKRTSFHFSTYAGREIQIWKEHVSPEKPRNKNGRRLKGGIQRYTWIGYVGDDCIAHEPIWHGGTRRKALHQCQAWAATLNRTAPQAEAVKALLVAEGKDDDWFGYFPVEHFVAQKNDLSLDADRLRHEYLIERRECMTAIGEPSLA